MNEIILAGKVVSLFVAVYYGMPWLGNLYRGHAIHWAQTCVVTAGIVGFITLQWLVHT